MVNYFDCAFCFSNTDHERILKRIFSFKVGYFHDCTESIFLMKTTEIRTSQISSYDLYWENIIDMRKRSIMFRLFRLVLSSIRYKHKKNELVPSSYSFVYIVWRNQLLWRILSMRIVVSQ